MPISYSELSAGPSTRRASLTGAVSAPSYEEWTKAQLVAEAERRGLSKLGNKPDLIERLQESD